LQTASHQSDKQTTRSTAIDPTALDEKPAQTQGKIIRFYGVPASRLIRDVCETWVVFAMGLNDREGQ